MNTKAKKRIIQYVILTIILFFGYIFFRNSYWQGSTHMHTVMEAVATLLAAIVGIMALVRFYSHKNNTFLFIGVGFLGTAFLDGYHTLVTSSIFSSFFPSVPSSLIPWSWTASRLFLAVLMFLSWYFWKREEELGEKGKVSEYAVYVSAGVLTLLVFLFFLIVPLPRAYYPELFFGRPEEFVPAIFFLLAFIGYIRKGHWKDDVFEHWVVISLIVGFISQVVFMSFSTRLFDFQFDFAHLLKKVSYLCVLVGLLISMYQLLKQGEGVQKKLEDQNFILDKTKRETGYALKNLQKKEKELFENIEDLNDTEIAALNILEDAEVERDKATEERDKVSAILHSIGDGVFVIDKNYNILIFNEVAAKISGFSQSEAVGNLYTSILKFVYEEGGKPNDQFIKDVFSTGETQDMGEHTILTQKNGVQIPVADSAAPIKNEEGDVIGCVVVFRDISKEREVDKAKTEFVSIASHQLRTPLSTINWYVEMLMAGDAGELNKEQKEFLDEVYVGSKRMSDLVSALLNVSRIELGTFAVDPELVDFAEISKSVLKELGLIIEEKNLVVKQNYGKNIPLIGADKKLIRIVFQNLISNAIKYTPKGGSVSVDLKKKDENLFISIADTGYGIPATQKDKIFSKLFRADNVREKDTSGTGLGLYIVKAIIDLADGKIWFESEENNGTTFFIEFPLAGMKEKDGSKPLE